MVCTDTFLQEGNLFQLADRIDWLATVTSKFIESSIEQFSYPLNIEK